MKKALWLCGNAGGGLTYRVRHHFFEAVCACHYCVFGIESGVCQDSHKSETHIKEYIKACRFPISQNSVVKIFYCLSCLNANRRHTSGIAPFPDIQTRRSSSSLLPSDHLPRFNPKRLSDLIFATCCRPPDRSPLLSEMQLTTSDKNRIKNGDSSVEKGWTSRQWTGKRIWRTDERFCGNGIFRHIDGKSPTPSVLPYHKNARMTTTSSGLTTARYGKSMKQAGVWQA